jgi:murein DD-endopeptidase MepM/ murein hydrolase activator NlpD
MIRLLLAFLLLFISAFAKTSVDSKIKSTSTKIKTYSKNHKNINKKMARNAKEILKLKRELNKQQDYLKKLKEELKGKESSYNANKLQLSELLKAQAKLEKESQELEQELVFTIAQSVSLSVILEEEYTPSEESMIEFEVFRVMLKNSKERIKKLNDIYFQNTKNINTLSEHASALEVSIATIDAKRKDLLRTQEKTKKGIKKLKLAKAAYKKELKKILKKQDTLKATLAKLNIIKIDEIKKAKEAAERAKAFRKKTIVSDKNLPTVKKHGSSYQAVKTKKYTGPKTIAPFYPYTITKKYGKYTDPIYGIKVFNESISLRPKEANTKVKTVFNGKVIYANKTAVLDNIVIVEHKNGLHTIYANLSQISPNIKKGKKIKKGYTIGRVNNELVFEVTQKSYHINPIRLFK